MTPSATSIPSIPSATPTPQAQRITFDLLVDITLGTAPSALRATTTSGLPISFIAGPPTVCTVAGTIVTVVKPGDCTVTANQGGTAQWAPAPTVSRTFAIRALLTVSVADGGTLNTGTASYAAGASVTLVPTASIGAIFTGWQIDGQPHGWASPLSLTMDTNHTVQATFSPATAFGDVDKQTPYTTAIGELAARGIIKGCDQEAMPKRFCPTAPTVRAQMAALVARAMGWVGPTTDNPFKDRCEMPGGTNCIDTELWGAVGQLAARAVARGYAEAGTCGDAQSTPCYAPRDNVLYVQIISFITRAMVAQGHWTAATTDDSAIYPNVPMSSGHRFDLITYAANVGPLPGTSAVMDQFPQWDQDASRGWFAEALWRALNSYFGTDRPGKGGYTP